jgi:hypothetical protein
MIATRLGPVCGLLFVFLLFGGASSGVEALIPLELAGLILFVPFAAYVASLVRKADPDGWLAATVLGAAVVDVALKLGSAAASLAADNTVEGAPIDTALHDMNSASFILTMYPLALFTAGIALAGLTYGAVPRWLAWFAAATAAALVVNGSFLGAEFGPGFLLFLVWTVTASVTMLLGTRAGRSRSQTDLGVNPAH